MLKNNFSKLWYLIIPGLILLMSSSASAHKVNIFAYAEGDTVYTESYFPDGRKVEGGKIEVHDSKGNKLLEGTTDKEGLFNFKIPKKDDLEIVLIATMGHRNSFTLSADELPDVAAASADAAPQAKQTPDRIKHHFPEKEPLPIAAILGGLGFIFGLTALILQLSGKKKG
jgi:nickel transport protein